MLCSSYEQFIFWGEQFPAVFSSIISFITAPNNDAENKPETNSTRSMLPQHVVTSHNDIILLFMTRRHLCCFIDVYVCTPIVIT